MSGATLQEWLTQYSAELRCLASYTTYDRQGRQCLQRKLFRKGRLPREEYEARVGVLLAQVTATDQTSLCLLSQHLTYHADAEKLRKYSARLKWTNHQMMQSDGEEEDHIPDAIRTMFYQLDMVLSGAVLRLPRENTAPGEGGQGLPDGPVQGIPIRTVVRTEDTPSPRRTLRRTFSRRHTADARSVSALSVNSDVLSHASAPEPLAVDAPLQSPTTRRASTPPSTWVPHTHLSSWSNVEETPNNNHDDDLSESSGGEDEERGPLTTVLTSLARRPESPDPPDSSVPQEAERWSPSSGCGVSGRSTYRVTPGLFTTMNSARSTQ